MHVVLVAFVAFERGLGARGVCCAVMTGLFSRANEDSEQREGAGIACGFEGERRASRKRNHDTPPPATSPNVCHPQKPQRFLSALPGP